MKYMLLIYNNPATYESFAEEERTALFAEVDEVMKELTESGELIATDALGGRLDRQDGPGARRGSGGDGGWTVGGDR